MNTIHAIPTVAGIYHALFSDQGVRRLWLPRASISEPERKQWDAYAVSTRESKNPSLAKRLVNELDAYHAGRRKRFTVPVDVSDGTAFRRRVWEAMRAIPYGTTMTYGALAAAVGCASARAVGQACGANPVPVLVPCHRVVAAKGLGGWSGADGWKTKLLIIEGVCAE